MYKKILKYSHLAGIITFGWQLKLIIKGINNPLYKPLAYVIGKINDFQMFFDKLIRGKL